MTIYKQPWRTPYPIWNQSVDPCPVLTVASWPAYRFLKRPTPSEHRQKRQEELKSHLRVKKESDKVGLKLKILKMKIMASGPITSWQIDGETVLNFIFGGSKITTNGDWNHEIKRHLLLERKVMTNLDSIFKSRDITLPTKVRLVKAMVFPVVMYGCESWTVKKAERRRIDVF